MIRYLGHKPKSTESHQIHDRTLNNYEQCSLYGEQLRSTTRPFAQWNLILAHLQHYKFNIA